MLAIQRALWQCAKKQQHFQRYTVESRSGKPQDDIRHNLEGGGWGLDIRFRGVPLMKTNKVRMYFGFPAPNDASKIQTIL